MISLIMKSNFIKKSAITMLVLAILIFPFTPIFGYFAVITAPVRATTVIEFDTIIKLGENSMDIDIEDYWSVRLLEPKQFLSGVSGLMVSINTGLENKEKDAIVIDLSFVDNSVAIDSIFVKQNEERYSTKKYVSSCMNTNADIVNSFREEIPQIKSDINIKELKQGFKKIKFDIEISDIRTTLYPHPYVKCPNGKPELFDGEPKQFHIENMKISIDSPVIYEWSTKGGTTYRL